MNKKLFSQLRPVFFAILCLSMIFVQGNLFAQSKVKVDFENTPLIKVLESISQQSNYRFVYTNELDVNGTKVSITSDNEPATALFNKLFNQVGITYIVKDNQVVLAVKGSAQTTTANPVTITGIVNDDATGEPLVGVTVQNVATKKFSYSDVNGSYSIEARPGDILLFSLIGMLDEQITVSSTAKVINAALKADVIALEDVVVTGYQTLSKERSTGSFSVVTSQKLESKLQPSVASILEGQTAGVIVNKDGSMEIRGVSTFSGVKDPLIVVDGYPLIGDGVGLESINPDNIENITVLKDAVAASIYGARASNGVIVVTTKHADKGSFNVTYKGTYGVTLKPQLEKLNLASVEDYMDAELDLYNQDRDDYYGDYLNNYRISDYAYLLLAKEKGLMSATEADAQIAALKNNNALDQIQEYLIRPKQSQQHNVSLSGGTEKNMFNGALRYSNEYGNLRDNNNSKVIVDLNNTWKPKEWFTLRIISNINYSKDNSTVEDYANLTSFTDTDKILPYTQLYDANGNPTYYSPVAQGKIDTYNTYPDLKSVLYHPESDLGLSTMASERLQLRLGGDITVKFTDFLTGSVGGSWITGSTKNRTIYDAESFYMRTAYNDATSISNPAKHYIPEGGQIDENRGTINSWIIRYQLNYNQSFNNSKHRVSAMLGGEVNKDTYEYTYLPTRLGYNPVSATYNSGFNLHEWNNNIGNISNDMLFGEKPIWSFDYGNNYGVRNNRFVSWYGNGSYEYNNKYLVTASVRLDLTNFFGTDPKFRYKPTWSVGGTWKLSQESFFEGAKDVINMLHIRASYGVNGNISLNNTPYLILSVGNHNQTMGGVSYGIASYPNNQLRWEKTQIFNVGFDAAFFSDRLNVSAEYYHKKSTDLIVKDAIDETKGTTSVEQNLGGLTNEGFEITIGGDIVRNSNFTYNSNLIMSHNRSNVDYYNIQRDYFSEYMVASGLLVEGYPMNGMWGAKFAGLSNEGRPQFYKADGETIVEGAQLKAEDAVYFGTLHPKLDMSWTNSFRFKNLEASFMFIGKFGHKYRKDAFLGTNYNNRHVGERWRQPGDEAHTIYPVLRVKNTTDYRYFPFADVLLGNASYVKLRDLTLAYHLPKVLVNKIGLQNVRVYFQTRNLFTITAKGVDIDPEIAEVNTGGTGLFTSQGYTSLPMRPEFYFGLQINL